MRAVIDQTGTRYALLATENGTSLVWNPERDEEFRVPSEDLEYVDTDGHASSRIPVADLLLAYVAVRGPLPVRELIDRTTLCESDLHGLLAELTAAGLLAETTLGDERAYEITEKADPWPVPAHE